MTTDTLRTVPLFESLSEDEATILCQYLETKDCNPEQVLFRAGDAGDGMYLIEDGKVSISMTAADGHEISIAELGKGDFFGEMAMLDGKPRSARATAIEPSRVAMLSREHFLSFVQGNSNVALEMLGALAHRLRRTDEILQNRITRNVNEEEAAHLTFGDRAADLIAEFGGSWKFIIASLALFIVWVVSNTIILSRTPFDPFPFILLNLALNMITALQAPIIMMSQNRQTHKDRLRADLDYAVNLKNELALSEILQRLQVLERDYVRLTGSAKRGGPATGGESLPSRTTAPTPSFIGGPGDGRE
jgi:CRP/FNR family transcriptional regulator, cyclic AMP receptor protein